MRSRHRPPESLLFAEFCKKFPVLRRMSRGDRFVSDCAHHHPVLPKPQIPAPTPNRPFLWRFSLVSFRSFRLWRHLRSLSPILASRLCIQKFRSPRQSFRRPDPGRLPGIFGVWEAKSDVSNPVRNYCGFNPRASNCWLHSAGASRSRSTPIPRGKRPSTAARTRSGARNASEIVMLT